MLWKNTRVRAVKIPSLLPYTGSMSRALDFPLAPAELLAGLKGYASLTNFGYTYWARR